MTLNVFNTENEVLEKLAAYFIQAANDAIAKNGRFSVALSGGSSPKKLYELLSSSFRNKTDWTKIYFFFGDERYVPLTHADSNYLMAKTSLFDPLDINAVNVYAVDTSLEPEAAAERYTADIRKFFGSGQLKFDLVLLGLGDDAHTASLFPGTPVLHDQDSEVKSVFLPKQQVYRITLTAPLINQAHRIAFLVYGKGKAQAVQQVIKGERDVDQFPAQLIDPKEGELQWFLDQAAGEGL